MTKNDDCCVVKSRFQRYENGLPRLLESQGVVLDSASRREAKRGQSTNRKGEMSRASRNKQKIVKEI